MADRPARVFAAAVAAVFVFLCAGCDAANVRAAVLPYIPDGESGTGAVDAGARTADAGARTPGAGFPALPGQTPYDSDTAVAIYTATDIYERADITSTRLTQLLFDEPVQVLERTKNWARIEAADGTEGWTRLRNLDGDWACVDGRRYAGRIVVTSREKQIYSHPRNGVVVRDIGMGTELFIISKSDNVYQVALPGNLTGWISENGVFQLDVGEAVKKTTAEIFARSCEQFKGISWLKGGVSFDGIDGAGLLYAAARINGVTLPRDYAGQFAGGEYAAPDMGAPELGDVLFFSPNGESAEVSDAGVYTGDGKFIHANQHTGRVQYEDINDPYFQQRILGARRYFD